MFQKENRNNTLSGILFVALFSMSATYLADFAILKHLGISPLIVGIVLGMIYANTLRNRLPHEWVPGILFSTKTILRTGIVLYGFRITFQNIEAVGTAGIFTSVVIVASTFIIGYIVGTKVLKLDKETTILTSAGSSICGAAAVLATEPVINAEPYKSAIAVSTVVVFGSIAMFLYPFLYTLGLIPLSPEAMGIYIGGTIHEVAHVVAAGNAVGIEAAKTAVIVKMIRVMLLAPFLVILGFWLVRTTQHVAQKQKSKITIPWFAVFFIIVAGFNSFNFLPQGLVGDINAIDTFLLTMAMTALGMETSVDKFKNVGMKPIYLATILFAWLMVGGFFIVQCSLSL
ncbi:YeiH family putative sulfate export transporter [Sulfurospirillum diekertiae]|uniref:YeiH family putative sulfate export transporter n=1 Tax=Sulfurospirillum diekertiae TaxID=1854492 RepID=A0A6G9VUE3_9BACT|nr:YeiH family protein [Sulfurospirillum diekertiae]QIR76320.1 YeiH family putative sulfate export transporter [Sulfurospirillum diekertiae]QIR78950.1 YeiH family putative sulfate export transporter [Sulfurospirillum diekertiae]